MSALLAAGIAVPLPCAVLGQELAGNSLSAAEFTQPQRDEIARRLAARGTPESTRLIESALLDMNVPAAQLSAARAIASLETPERIWIDPLFAMLKNSPNEQTTRAAAQALSRYGTINEVLIRLSDIAKQRNDSAMRLHAIEAIGGFPDRAAAEVLMQVLTQPDESAKAVNAASAGLEAMTGMSSTGRDQTRWIDWWEQNRGKLPEQFRTDLLIDRARRFDQTASRLKQLTAETEAMIHEQYRAASVEARAGLLLRWLQADSPEIRGIGARQARDDAAQARTVPDTVIQRLREMIGDADMSVRLETVGALQRINDPDSLQPLLEQLKLEPSADVRGAIARALGPLGNLDAVPVLLDLLTDRSTAVVLSAASALKDLAPKLAEQNAPLARDAAKRLQTSLSRTNTPGMQDLRVAIVGAMVPLKSPEMAVTYRELLKRGEPSSVRRLAVKGIGELNDRDSEALVGPLLNDPDRTVQLEAVITIGKLNAIEYSDRLVSIIQGGTNDQSIKDASWTALQGFMPSLKSATLRQYANDFKNDPAKRLLLLQRLRDNQAVTDPDAWADTLTDIGQSHMELGEYADAATAYQLALAQKLSQSDTPEQVILRLVTDRMKALLRAEKYDDAAAFATEWMKKQIGFGQTMGTEIRKEADRLLKESIARNEPRLLERALELIDKARKLENPHLPRQYVDQLGEIESDIRKQMANRDKQGSGITPQGNPGAATADLNPAP